MNKIWFDCFDCGTALNPGYHLCPRCHTTLEVYEASFVKYGAAILMACISVGSMYDYFNGTTPYFFQSLWVSFVSLLTAA